MRSPPAFAGGHAAPLGGDRTGRLRGGWLLVWGDIAADQGGAVAIAAARSSGLTGGSPMKKPSTWGIASRDRDNQSQLLLGLRSCSCAKASRRRVLRSISVATLPPKYCMMSNSSLQNLVWHRPGTTARSRQIS